MKRTLITAALILTGAMFAADASAGYTYRTHHYSAYALLTGEYVGYATIDETPEQNFRCYDDYEHHYYVVGVIKTSVNPETGEGIPSTNAVFAGRLLQHGLFGPLPSFDDVFHEKDGVTYRFRIVLPLTHPSDFIWQEGIYSWIECNCTMVSPSSAQYGHYHWSESPGPVDTCSRCYAKIGDPSTCYCHWMSLGWFPFYRDWEEYEENFDRVTGSTADTRAHFGN